MKLRKSLTPSATPDRINTVKKLILNIENNFNKKLESLILIKEFNEFTGKNYDEFYFHTYWNSISIDDFARDAAQPNPVKDPEITKKELIEIVNRIRSVDENTDFYLSVLSVNLPHPRVSNLIFWPEEEGLKEDPTSEEIINKALSYKPIQL